jgi:hypothetical protein
MPNRREENMTDKLRKELELTDRMIDLIDRYGDLTTSDYQAMVQAIIHEALNYEETK